MNKNKNRQKMEMIENKNEMIGYLGNFMNMVEYFHN